MLFVLSLSVSLAASLDIYEGDDLVTLTSSLQPGDEIRIHKGVYSITDGVTWSGLGSEAAPIVIKGVEDDVVIELVSGWLLVNIDTSSYMRIENIHFQGGEGWETDDYSGLQISESNNIVVRDCSFSSFPGIGISLRNNNTAITIEHNEISDTLNNAFYAGCSDGACWTDTSLISNNLIHDIGNDGIEFDPGGQGNTLRDNVLYNIIGRGMVVDTTLYGPANTVEGNAVWNVGESGIMIRGASIVRNNIIFLGTQTGIQTERSDTTELSDVVISSNTIAMTTQWGVDLNNWFNDNGDGTYTAATNMVFSNNVVSNPLGYGLRMRNGLDQVGHYIAGNIVTGLVDGWSEGLVSGGGDWDFGDVIDWDFYPTADAVLVNGGDPNGAAYVPEVDFNGLAREGDKPDVGAYEWYGDGNPGWPIQEGFKETLTNAPGRGEEIEGGCCKDKSDSSESLLLFPLAFLAWKRRKS